MQKILEISNSLSIRTLVAVSAMLMYFLTLKSHTKMHSRKTMVRLVVDTLTSNQQKVQRFSVKVSKVSVTIGILIVLDEAAKSMPSDCKTLFVKGLPYTFKEDDVGDRFRRFGEIKAIRLAYNW